MRSYLKIASLAWQEYIIYRLNFWFELIGRFFHSILFFVVWLAVFRARGGEAVESYTLSAMFTYLFAAMLIESLYEISSQGDEINDDIREGRLGAWLARPISALSVWLVRDIMRRVFTFVFGFFEWLVIFIFVRGYVSVPTIDSFFAAAAVILLAIAVNYYLFSTLSLLAFWLEQTWGPRFVFRVIIPITAGTFIPLNLFPSFWQTIFSYTPFPMMIYVPASILTFGQLPAGAGTMLASGVVWLAVLIISQKIIWRCGVRHYQVVESI